MNVCLENNEGNRKKIIKLKLNFIMFNITNGKKCHY